MVGTHHPRRLTVELQRINDYVWEIPRQGGMRVPGRIYASEKLMAELRDDPALGQVANMAHLPGIVGHALAMPDIHWGYGFPIGGVAAVDAEEGAISPGGIGFDINCGVRLLRTALAADDLGPHLGRLADALRTMGRAMARYGIDMPDRQLACVPLRSPEGQQYFAAMAAAANFAWTNRQVMSGLAERAFAAALGLGPAALRFGLVYDVCHNIAKLEEHTVDGRLRRVCVHRKGATRAFGPGHPALATHLRPLGQPVIIPGDMGRYSFLLLGTAGAMAETFGTTCHGAGRVMSRAQAKKAGRGLDLVAAPARRGVIVRAQSLGGVAEEMPWAYKDVADVVEVVERAGLARRVAKLKPLVVAKG